MAYTTPVKSFGTDTDSGLEKRIKLKRLIYDEEKQFFQVNYEIILVTATNYETIIGLGEYHKTPAKFATLKAAAATATLMTSIQNDFNSIQNFDTLNTDLNS